jgi:cytoskeletal protein CcmA (bactofilin family)
MIEFAGKDSRMFSKTADPTAAPQRPASGSTGTNNRSIFSADLKIVGDVSSTGTVEVMGEVEGTIAAHTLTIGGEGRVQGQIAADSVEIKGKMDGRIDANSFVLRAAAQVTADVSYVTLVIESGASVDGRFSKPKA